ITTQARDTYLKALAQFYSGMICTLLSREEEARGHFRAVLGSGIGHGPVTVLSLFYLQKDTIDEKGPEVLLDEKNGKPVNNMINLFLADRYFRTGQEKELLQALNYGISLELNQDIYYRYFYRYYLTRNDLERSLLYIKKLINEYPSSIFQEEARFNYACLLFQEKEYSEAGKLFQTLAETSPDSPYSARTLYFLGFIHFEQKEYEEAEKNLLSAIKGLEPGSALRTSGISLLAGIYVVKEEYRKNISLLAPVKDPAPDLMYTLAYSYSRTEQGSRALELVQDILDRPAEPDTHYRAFLLLHSLCTNTGNDGPLLKYIFKIKENRYVTGRDFINYILDLAGLQHRNRNYRESVNQLLNAITYDMEPEQKIRINLLLYRDYRSLKWQEKASAVLDTLIRLDPDNAERYRQEKEESEQP
ncbi:MAG: tetratricopeptide repeat protein, partial [bacterium]|nr:tetratricopeptide repeat protein [bacterium]